MVLDVTDFRRRPRGGAADAATRGVPAPPAGAAAPLGTDRRGPADRRPAGLAVFAAYVVPLTVCVLAGRADSPLRLAVEVGILALVVAIVGFEATAAAGLVAIGSSLLSLNGFGLHEFGELGWHPSVDVPVAVALLCVWAVAWSAREGVPVPGRSYRAPTTVGAPSSEEGEA